MGTEVQTEGEEEWEDRKHPFQCVLPGRGAENRAMAGKDAESKKRFYPAVRDTKECLHTDGRR